jgi:uncharacterized repeat protein (TIGR03803 family)
LVLASAVGVAAGDYGYMAIYSFAENGDAQTPSALIADEQGNLYGTARGGQDGVYCGSIFKLAPDGTRTTLHFFKGPPDDSCGPVGIAFGRHGAIYGTAGGGTNGYGTVFRLSKGGQEQVIAKFDLNTGIFPFTGPIRGHDGNFYGTLSQAGDGKTAGPGTIFKITPEGQLSVVHAFDGHLEGCRPRGGLVQDKAGMLYGATDTCGATGQGVIYKVDPATGTETVLHAFSGVKDGAHAISSLTMDDHGNLYGGTLKGGNDNAECGHTGCGIVFEMKTDGKYRVLYAFKNLADGYGISGPLFRDRFGTIFGTARFGGDPQCFCGLVFKLSKGGKTKTTMHIFQGVDAGDGAYPSGLVAARHRESADVFLYGPTDTGGACTDQDGEGCGIIYKIAKR